MPYDRNQGGDVRVVVRIHVAIGHGYPEKTGSGWKSDAHCDAVLKNTTIVVEGQTIMRDGSFLI